MTNCCGDRRLGALVARGPAVRIGVFLLVLTLIGSNGAAAGDILAENSGAASQTVSTSIVAGKKRIAVCSIRSDHISIFEGPCELQQFDSKGSFNISREDENVPLNEDVLLLTVTLTGKTSAHVSAVTTSGHLSQWGTAKLSKKSTACWLGERFRICTR
jgi:hypothetical protein